MDESSSSPTEFVAPTLEELIPLFPAYEIEAFIAQGGMGAVYKARQKSLDRDVAIKILPREFGDDPQFRASFEAEAKAMARLNHPNLISVYDFGDIEGMLFIIMEFVQGKALFYSAHKKVISPKVAIPLVSTICRGLAHAHKGGIIHRDIKPANILLDIDATPKIGDFGLARPADLNDSEGAVFGTPGYTAPEIFQRRPVDERSDVFSVGAMLYELTSGKAPKANTYQLTSGVDPRLDAIIKKATHPDPEHRQASADVLADELDKLASSLRSSPSLATANSSSPRPIVTSGKSSSTGPVLATLAALLLGGGALAYLLTKDKKAEDPPIAETPAETDQTIDQKEKKKGKANNGNQNRPDKIAKNNKQEEKKNSRPMPEPEPKPKPKPKLTPTPSEEENALTALTRLRTDLRKGQRSEFPPTSVERNGSQYLLIDKKLTWSRATLFAKNHGAQLAVLKTSDDLKWAQETFKAKTALWLGASDSGMENKWHWSEGQAVASELWSENQPDDTPSDQDGEDFIALSAAQASLEDLPEDRALPFLIEWKLDASQPGSLDSQLERAGLALDAKLPPIFPNGTRNIGGSRFLLVSKTLSWDEASALAEKAGGHLAVPSNQDEAAYLTTLMQKTLDEGDGCWIGGKRTASGASTWTTVTGERFAFLNWLPEEPDNFNGDQDAVKLQLREGKIGINDTPIPVIQPEQGQPVTSFVIEWSHPSLRNMPEEGEAFANSDKYAEPLDEIRKKIIGRHGRNFLRYQTKKEKIITKFVDDSTKDLEEARAVAAPLVEKGLKFLNDIKESMDFPYELPAGFGKRMGQEFKETRNELDELWNKYEAEFNEAKSDYFEALAEIAATATQNTDPEGAKYFTKEIALVDEGRSRLSKILRSEPVDPPVEKAESPDKKALKKLYFGEWESEGPEDKKVKILLRPNGAAILKSHGGGKGEWTATDDASLGNIEIGGFKIEVRPVDNQLHAKDQNGHSYLLKRVE